MTDKFNSELVRGSLDLMVLSILADGPKYGYRIAQSLREASGDLVGMPAGTLYPLLHRLEDDKLIQSRWDDSTGRRRKWYELTAAGRSRVHQQARQWQAYVAVVERLLTPVLDPSFSPA